MTHPAEAFRARYRASISPCYSGALHGLFVLGYGLAWIVFFATRTESIRPLEWLTVVFGLVLFNWGEYMVHLHLGHHKRKLGALFYKRHTGDHHSFFVAGKMRYESLRDWRVVLFPAWLIVLFSGGALLLWWLLSMVNANVAALLSATLLAGYLSYEVLHACEHLPSDHPVSRLPWIRHMRHLHALHHRRDLMHTHNFNIVFPLMDWLYGTLYWEPMVEREA